MNMPTFNVNSAISLGLMLIVLGACWNLSAQLTSLNLGQGALVKQIENMATESKKNPWTGTDMFKWAVQLQRENKTLVVPEPKHSE